MATEFFLKLWDNHIIQLGVWQTVYMTFLTSLFAYVIGLPLGVVLWVTDKDGLHPNKGVNTVLGFIVNFFRSIPAVILMVAMIPAARLLLGTSTGNGAVIVTLIIAATILSYTALAATLGGTGLGQVAIIYGHQRSQKLVVWVCVFLIVIIVQVIQIVGTRILRRTDKRAR